MDSSNQIGGPINIGNPNELTVFQLADALKDMIGSESQMILKELPNDDPKQRQSSIGLVRSKLDWQPTVDLEEGLLKAIKYFRTVLRRSFLTLYTLFCCSLPISDSVVKRSVNEELG